MIEQITRQVSIAMMMIDDLTSLIVRQADVNLMGSTQNAIVKPDGFCVISDVEDGTYSLTIKTPIHQHYLYSLSLPLPADDRFFLRVPGENEEYIVIESVDAASLTIHFAARSFRPGLDAGTSVITSRLETALVTELEGEGIDSAELTDVGSGGNRLRTGDVVRFVRDGMIRLKAGPYYPFTGPLLRVVGAVRESGSNLPLKGVEVTVRRVNRLPVSTQQIGTTPENRIRLCTAGGGGTVG